MKTEMTGMSDKKIAKVQIRTYMCGMLMPMKGDEQAQHLTISDSGRVWFTRYLVGDELRKPVSDGVRQASIGADEARRLLDMIGLHEQDLNLSFCTDVGNWEMMITYVDGTTKKHRGSLFSSLWSDGVDVSKEIHDAMPFEGVMSFGYYEDDSEEPIENEEDEDEE